MWHSVAYWRSYEFYKLIYVKAPQTSEVGNSMKLKASLQGVPLSFCGTNVTKSFQKNISLCSDLQKKK